MALTKRADLDEGLAQFPQNCRLSPLPALTRGVVVVACVVVACWVGRVMCGGGVVYVPLSSTSSNAVSDIELSSRTSGRIGPVSDEPGEEVMLTTTSRPSSGGSCA